MSDTFKTLTKDMEVEDIKKLIEKFEKSNEYRVFQEMKESITFLDIFNKTRKETYHSAILSWILKSDEFNMLSEPPALLLLQLANRIFVKNKGVIAKDAIESSLSMQILSRSLKLHKITSDTEISTTASNNQNGRVDIVVKCKDENNNNIRIILENKIDFKEGVNQCGKYFEFFNNLQDDFLNVYIFLSPQKPSQLSSDKFIPITYQELLDEVLYPVAKYKTGYTSSAFYLREYINTITSIKTDKILAMNDEYKNLLYKFYNDNKDLINALIDVAEPDSKKRDTIKASLSRATQYTIVYQDKSQEKVTGGTELALAIAKHLAGSLSYEELLSNWQWAKNNGSSFILNEQAKYSNDTRKYYTEPEIKCDNKSVWCSNQWPDKKVKKLIEEVGKIGITVYQ